MLLRHVVLLAVTLLRLFPLGALVVVEKVLAGRVVRLGVVREPRLRGGHVHRVRGALLVGVGPEGIELRFGDRRLVGDDAALTDGADDLHDLWKGGRRRRKQSQQELSTG